MEEIRILIADDQALVAGALSALLNLEPDFNVVAQVSDGTGVVQAAQSNRVDVALLDIEMPGMDGITAAEKLHEACPSCAVLMVTTFGRPGYLQRALQAGVLGFIVKDTPSAQLADAMRRVHQGLRVIDPTLAEQTLTVGQSPLHHRETQVLQAASGGATVGDIARTTFLSTGTVRNYLSSAMGKLEASTRAEAVLRAQQNGLLL